MENMIEKTSVKRKREISINFRVSEKELELITSRMEQTGIKNRRAYMLKMATDGQVIHLDLSGIREMVRLLSNATNNINQIARRVNETGNFYAADLDDLCEKYGDIWGQMKEILRRFAEL
jgi:hypothetical protein